MLNAVLSAFFLLYVTAFLVSVAYARRGEDLRDPTVWGIVTKELLCYYEREADGGSE